ncbi:hypothetical protein Dimus_000906, partial [Dionaea muscipula]
MLKSTATAQVVAQIGQFGTDKHPNFLLSFNFHGIFVLSIEDVREEVVKASEVVKAEKAQAPLKEMVKAKDDVLGEVKPTKLKDPSFNQKEKAKLAANASVLAKMTCAAATCSAAATSHCYDARLEVKPPSAASAAVARGRSRRRRTARPLLLLPA